MLCAACKGSQYRAQRSLGLRLHSDASRKTAYEHGDFCVGLPCMQFTALGMCHICHGSNGTEHSTTLPPVTLTFVITAHIKFIVHAIVCVTDDELESQKCITLTGTGLKSLHSESVVAHGPLPLMVNSAPDAVRNTNHVIKRHWHHTHNGLPIV